jgi:hypothetical protein
MTSTPQEGSAEFIPTKRMPGLELRCTDEVAESSVAMANYFKQATESLMSAAIPWVLRYSLL